MGVEHIFLEANESSGQREALRQAVVNIDKRIAEIDFTKKVLQTAKDNIISGKHRTKNDYCEKDGSPLEDCGEYLECAICHARQEKEKVL